MRSIDGRLCNAPIVYSAVNAYTAATLNCGVLDRAILGIAGWSWSVVNKGDNNQT